MRMLRYSKSVTAIKSCAKTVIGFGIPDLPYSGSIRDSHELRAMFKKNPALARNVAAHYLHVCGFSTSKVGKFFDISPSRVSH